jgi:hypothetical protein
MVRDKVVVAVRASVLKPFLIAFLGVWRMIEDKLLGLLEADRLMRAKP